ncbi:hypothetical protein XH98_27320 [Bradyrhizobium sp. CCBAU 51745]|nr:hypothetical protein [Bradyrhizobium sp. CCBAU 51745]
MLSNYLLELEDFDTFEERWRARISSPQKASDCPIFLTKRSRIALMAARTFDRPVAGVHRLRHAVTRPRAPPKNAPPQLVRSGRQMVDYDSARNRVDSTGPPAIQAQLTYPAATLGFAICGMQLGQIMKPLLTCVAAMGRLIAIVSQRIRRFELVADQLFL